AVADVCTVHRCIRAVGAHDNLPAWCGYRDGGLEVRGRAGRRENRRPGVGGGRPGNAAVAAFRHDDVVLPGDAAAGVGPDGREVPRVGVIDREGRIVVAADVQRVDALLRPAAEVTEREVSLIVES